MKSLSILFKVLCSRSSRNIAMMTFHNYSYDAWGTTKHEADFDFHFWTFIRINLIRGHQLFEFEHIQPQVSIVLRNIVAFAVGLCWTKIGSSRLDTAVYSMVEHWNHHRCPWPLERFMTQAVITPNYATITLETIQYIHLNIPAPL